MTVVPRGSASIQIRPGISNCPVHVLLIEDDRQVAASVIGGLREQGWRVIHAADGVDGLELARQASHQVLIVDRMLPSLDGLSLVKLLRAASITTPVLFLTTMSGIDDRVHGLEAGGDDYLVKPFALVELVARVRVLLRRSSAAASPTRLQVGELRLDLLQRTAMYGGRPVDLLPQEFRLLEYLARHVNRVVTRAMLLENVWDIHFDPRTSVVESHMSRLRAKLNQQGAMDLIQTIRGAGYRLLA